MSLQIPGVLLFLHGSIHDTMALLGFGTSRAHWWL